jgi:hypothetical protein
VPLLPVKLVSAPHVDIVHPRTQADFFCREKESWPEALAALEKGLKKWFAEQEIDLA